MQRRTAQLRQRHKLKFGTTSLYHLDTQPEGEKGGTEAGGQVEQGAGGLGSFVGKVIRRDGMKVATRPVPWQSDCAFVVASELA